MKYIKKLFILFSVISLFIFNSCLFNESNISDISTSPLGIPTNVIAESSNSGIRISWNKVDGADSYRLYYAEDSESYMGYYSVTSTSYIDTDVYPGDIWYYFVRAVKKDVLSDISYTVYGQMILQYGRLQDVQSYQYNYLLEYTDQTKTIRGNIGNGEDYLSAGYYRYHYFPVKGGHSYVIRVADADRYVGVLSNPAKVNVICFPAAAEYTKSINITSEETTFKSELTGYYMLKVQASSEGNYIIEVELSAE